MDKEIENLKGGDPMKLWGIADDLEQESHKNTMNTENDTSKPEDSPQQEAGEGCSGATCSPCSCRQTYDADWIPAEFAPKDHKIMGFFEDIGWYPACWSEANQMWSISYCAGVPDTNPEEPRWTERMVYDSDLCWWRKWPNQTWPGHSQENSQADRPQGSV